MSTNNTDTPKIKALQQLYDVIEIDIKRDFAEPILYKGRPTWMGGNGVIKLDKEREEERRIQLHRKYDERVREAISIWETYPDCSEPPMSNPSPKIGLHELKVWARKELKDADTNIDPASKQEKDGEGKNDLMTLTVAVQKFDVSKTTLRRAIKEERLKNYNTNSKSKNSLVMISENEVEKYWPRR